jgi:hypothetical protein
MNSLLHCSTLTYYTEGFFEMFFSKTNDNLAIDMEDRNAFAPSAVGSRMGIE